MLGVLGLKTASERCANPAGPGGGDLSTLSAYRGVLKVGFSSPVKGHREGL
jgi:hypothetical protein